MDNLRRRPGDGGNLDLGSNGKDTDALDRKRLGHRKGGINSQC